MKDKNTKIRSSFSLPTGIFESVNRRILAGSNFSARVETDLVRYDKIIKTGLVVIKKKLVSNEVLYLAQRLFGQAVDNDSISLWLSRGLQHLAYNPMEDEDDEDEEFGINRNELSGKLEAFSIMERIALLEFLEQVFQLNGNTEKKEYICKTFE